MKLEIENACDVEHWQTALASGTQARRWCWLAIISAVLIAGCEPSLLPVKGRVTLDGQPLSEALIMFVPLGAGQKKTGASITQGAYEIQQANGLSDGKYRVEITDNPPLELAHRPPGEMQAALRRRRMIPSLYGENSPLSVEIGGDSEADLQQFDFQLVGSTQQAQINSKQ
jgi:hypothetical protein